MDNQFSPNMHCELCMVFMPSQLPQSTGRQMSTDPFEQFERSRGGLVIPLALFVMGGCLTYAAVSSLHGVVLREAEVARMIEAVPASDANPNEGSVVAPDVTADK